MKDAAIWLLSFTGDSKSSPALVNKEYCLSAQRPTGGFRPTQSPRLLRHVRVPKSPPHASRLRATRTVGVIKVSAAFQPALSLTSSRLPRHRDGGMTKSHTTPKPTLTNDRRNTHPCSSVDPC
jgi:hypothetical protein